MDWIELTQDRDRWQILVNAVMNAGNFLTSWETVSFPRRPLLHAVSCLLIFTFQHPVLFGSFYSQKLSAERCDEMPAASSYRTATISRAFA
jgi:hypothetical protein